MNKLTLIIVDDHPLFRQGVVDSLALETDMEFLGQASTGEEGLEMARALKPHIVIMDVNMPGMNGQQVTHIMAQEKLPSRVILLTGYDDTDQALHAVMAGAAGYCSKEIDSLALAEGIREVAGGKFIIGTRLFTRRELDAWVDEQLEGSRRSYSEPGSPFHPLSDREMEVLECVVRGMSNKEIATMLGISHQTVKNHVTSILRKFGVEDRTQAVVYALKRGWVTLKNPKKQE
ncbi:MAG: response regulator transcription factor [Chloroflexota bacterium]